MLTEMAGGSDKEQQANTVLVHHREEWRAVLSVLSRIQHGSVRS